MTRSVFHILMKKKVRAVFPSCLQVLLPFCLLTFLSSPLLAQQYFNLTAQQVKIDSLLPAFAYSWPLDSRYADSTYVVSIAYPELIPMSADDVKRYEQITGGVLPPSMPKITQQVCVSRKKAQLEVSFVPIVFHDGKYQKLVSFQLKKQAVITADMPSRRVASRAQESSSEGAGTVESSVLATGRWAKIRVPSSGVYQLTDDLIRRAGFSNINKVRVYGYGGAMQPESLFAAYIDETDDLREVPQCIAGGRHLFWAQGPVSWNNADRIRNPYSQYGYYFLTESDGEILTESENELTARYVSSGELSNTLYEVDDFAWYHGGRNLYDARLFTVGQSRDYTVSSAGTRMFIIWIVGKTQSQWITLIPL